MGITHNGVAALKATGTGAAERGIAQAIDTNT